MPCCTLSVASEGKDKGSTFTVVLPRSVANTADQPATAAGPPTLQGLRVLLVDDDADALEMFAAILAGAGAVPTTAGGGQR